MIQNYWTDIEFLHFHLGYDDAKSLMGLTKVKNDPVSLKMLTEFISMCDSVKLAVQGAKIGEQRKHALIGQTILNKKVVVQRKDVMIVLDQNFPEEAVLCEQAVNKGKTLIGTSFLSQKEFDILEDDYDLNLDFYHKEDLVKDFIGE